MKFPLEITFQKKHRVASDSSQSNFSIMPHHERRTKIKLFRGLLIPLAAASSATASGSSVASASASLRDRSHSQPVLSWFQHVSSINCMHYHWPETCPQDQPRHISSAAACSSAGASASATSSEAGAWQRVFTAQMPSWVSFDSISTRNPQSIHLHKSRRISSHIHKTKPGIRRTRARYDKLHTQKQASIK